MNIYPIEIALQESADFLQQELGFVILLTIAAAVAIITRRFVRVPYTVALVIVGLALSFFPNFLGITVSSDLILHLLVPPLVFEATLQINWPALKRNLVPITLLAVGGVLLSTIIVGEMVAIMLPEIPIVGAVAFGALISATDPVAVVSFFRSMGVSKRLALLVEGESLFNDGIAIVIFSLAVGLGAGAGLESIDPGGAIFEFLWVSLGGLGVGIILGLVVSQLVLYNVDDHLIETATTVALAFGAFLVAEKLGVSGILAVVAAGLFVGNVGFRNTSPTTRLTIQNFWEFLAFVTNSIIFLIIGLQIDLQAFDTNLTPILVAVGAVLFSRAIVVYSISWLSGRLDQRNYIPPAFRHVMFWGGLRGAISLALALTLSDGLLGPGVAQELQVMTFGVVLFTLLVQGTTIAPLIRRLGLSKRPDQHETQQRIQSLLFARQEAKRELGRLQADGLLPAEIWKAIDRVYDLEIEQKDKELQQLLLDHPELEQELVLQARRDLLRAERTALADALRRGLLQQELYDQLVREIDYRAAALDHIVESQGIPETEGK